MQADYSPDPVLTQEQSTALSATAQAESTGMLMENATSNEHNMQSVQNASTTQVCALIIAYGAAAAAKG